MLIDGVTRPQLQNMTVEALRAGDTLAGDRVFQATDWPTRPELFPMLLVAAPRERKVPIFPGQLEFNTTISIVIIGRIVGPLPDPVSDALEVLEEQIVNVMLLNLPAYHAVQQFNIIDVQSNVNSDGKQHIGEVGITFDAQVYQVYGPTGPDLINITGTIQPGDGPPIVFTLPTNS